MHFCPVSANSSGGVVGAGEAHGVMAGADELSDDRGANEAGRACDEYAHEGTVH